MSDLFNSKEFARAHYHREWTGMLHTSAMYLLATFIYTVLLMQAKFVFSTTVKQGYSPINVTSKGLISKLYKLLFIICLTILFELFHTLFVYFFIYLSFIYWSGIT